MGSFFSLGKFSNDTQENSKDAQKKEEALKRFQEENAKLNRDKTDLARERDKLERENKNLTTEKDKLDKEKTELNDKNKKLTAEKDNLTKDKAELQKQVKDLQDSKQVLENEKAELTNENTKLKNEKTDLTEKNKNLTTEKERLERENKNLTADRENLTTALSKAESQASQTSQKLNELERRHAPYQKLEKLYEVFLEVKDRLNFGFVEKTHSAMDLIASVLSDSKYYLESLYNKASQELGDKRSDKGEKLAELFDLLFEYIKDSKFECLKEPSAYDYSCKTLYPEQNSSQKIQRVVLRGYKHNDKVYHTIVDMGS
ncbi:hypothetical protein EXS82_02020 [Helicobacter pylori]|uniref:hypothetical protein n=1 Tax=Helicobacter pylori TaxID=210 RepID=UPI0013F4421A|nr:hypothetical protein [Helicobacter pylori]